MTTIETLRLDTQKIRDTLLAKNLETCTSPRVCIRCKKLKPISYFYKNKGACKKCKIIAANIRQKTTEAIMARKTPRRRALNNATSKRYAATEAGKLNRRQDRYKDNISYKLKYPEKVRAHQIVADAIRGGNLIPQACKMCGSNEGIHAHHENYSNPLRIMWLCRLHHATQHRLKNAQVPTYLE